MAEKDNKELVFEIAKKFGEFVRKDMIVSKIILYGSYSKGTQSENSDIDIAVVSPDFSGDRIEDRFRLMKYRRNIDLRIEPMPFTPEEFDMENPFVREIIETGIEVK
jgi:predicted nucleotidyltransferase